MKLIDNLEGSNYSFAHILWSKLEDLKSSLQRQSEGSFGEKTMNILSTENSIDHSMMLKTAAQKSLDKLLVHMGPNPTNECYKHIGRLFCPSEAANVPSSSVNSNSIVESFAKIPFFKSVPQEELIDGYSHFHRQLLRLVGQEAPVDVMQVLVASKSCYPGFAKAAIQCLNCPVNSVDAERYFSIYNIVVTDRRQTMKDENVEITTMLAFN